MSSDDDNKPKLINLTPHAITLLDPTTKEVISVIPASGTEARVTEAREITGNRWGVPITAVKYGDVTGLPDWKHKVSYLVSFMVAQKKPTRPDLFFVGPLVRNEKGEIIGTTGLSQFPDYPVPYEWMDPK